nr:MAG TPA: hypothetical protein [Caudoviricetes sp.]
MNELINKDSITTLELLKQINIFREQEGNNVELQHYDLLKIVRDEFKEEIDDGKISCISYKDSMNRNKPMYILSFNQAKQILIRENKYVRKAVIHYIEELENKLKQNTPAITEEQRLVLSIYAGGVEAVEATKALVELKTKELQKTIEYKEDVIIGLTDDIELKDKRQILNQVVRYKGANYQERWKKLYYEFEKFYHINLDVRIKNYNEKNKPKIKSKLDYIDKVMNKLPKLYEIASKLYEGDIEKIIAEYKEVV